MSFFSKSFLNDIFERAVRSFAGAYVVAGVVSTKDVFSVESLQLGLGAALASVLLGFATKNIGSDSESASVL